MSSTPPDDTSVSGRSAQGERDHSLFRTLIRTTRDGVLVLDQTGVILVCNDAATRLFGYSPQTILGTAVARLIVDTYRAGFAELIAKAAEASPLAPFSTTVDIQGLRQDGSQLPLQISLGQGMLDDGPALVAIIHDQTQLYRERTAHDEEKAYAALIVETANDAVISYMLDGTIRSWNKAAERMFGYKAEEIVGANAQTLMPMFIPASVMEAERSIFTRVLAGEAVPPHESVRLHRDSTPVPVRISASPIRDAQGHVIGISRTVRDLREMRAFEEQRALLSALVTSSSDAIISYALDGTILSWNPAAEAMYGYSASEMVGTNFYSRIDDFVSKDIADIEKETVRKVMAGLRVPPYEAMRTRKDGTPIYVLVSVSPIRDSNGKIVGTSRTVRDRSERRAFEQQRALLSSIVESSHDAVFSKTLDGIVTSWNGGAETMFGYQAGEIIGQSVNLIIPEDHADEERQTLATLRDGKFVRHFETMRRKKDGTVFDVSISFAPLRDAQGNVIGTAATVRDISERKDYERRLQAMREDLIHVARVHELSQVSAGIAHELNQPLAAMLNYSNAAKRIVATNEPDAMAKLPDVTVKIGEQAERAAQIIRRMRDFVEKRDPHRANININTITDDALALALIGTKSANLTIQVQRTSCTATVLADAVQIQQVLVNLLRNAAEAMVASSRRELTLTIRCNQKAFIEVAVKDTGTGIPEHVAQRLFAPFITTKPEGMGIGLAISKSIIDGHGGTMGAEPNPEGGTIFRFTLPASCSNSSTCPLRSGS